MRNILIFMGFLLVSNFYIQSQNVVFEFQNSEKIESYLVEHQLKFNNNDIVIFKVFEDFFKFNNDGYLIGPVVHVFNKDGLYLEYIKIADIIDKLANFKRIRNKPKKEALHIDSWFNGLVNYKTLQPLVKQQNTDYYFVLSWAKFFNKPENIDAVFKWYEVLERQKLKGENIQIVLLNMDFQDSWELSPEKKEDLLKQANK
ncbi:MULTISPECIES: hypothetical protein [Bizionia]|uniref:Uncharacterized protein n=1 Tax=Bizionia algoritergicola TaxID=291187 RepID=A0A5D0R0Q0_9FLAO|nr:MULTISPECIES: hypothetical protein [Bizionia]TYB75102.1 hypothetical protein ES675_02925 [Bizionia algoritergicola]